MGYRAAGLARWALRRPRLALALPLAATLAAAPGLARLELRTDGHSLVPAGDPAVLFDAEVRERYGLRDPVVVLLESRRPEGIYHPEALRKVARATAALAAVEGIGERHVTSLATERRDEVYPGTLTFRPFLDPLPETAAELADLRGDLDAAGLPIGTLVSADGTAAAVLAGVPAPGAPGEGGSADRARLVERIRAAVEPLAGPDDAVRVVGAPVAESLLGRHVLDDLALLVPAALAVMALVLWLGCRRLAGVALALGQVGACLVFTFGLMGWTGSPVHLTTAVLPVILVTVGLADEIHVFWHVQRRLAGTARGAVEGESSAAAVAETMETLALPVVLTSATTGLAFLSFLASGIGPVRAFGLWAAVGVGFCLVSTLTAVPAALALLPRRRFVHPRPDGPARRGEGLARLLAPALAHPRRTLVALGAVTLALGLGLPRLAIQDSWLDGFAPESALRRDTARVGEKLLGTHVLLVEVAFDPAAGAAVAAAGGTEAPLLVPANLEAIGAFERFLAARPEVGGVLGPHRQAAAVHHLWMARRDGTRGIPDRPERLETLYRRYADARGEHRLREVFAPGLDRAVVTVFLGHANFRDTGRLMAAARAWAAEHLAPLGASIGFAGDVAVSQAMIPAIVRTQLASLALALAGAVAVVAFLRRSLAEGLVVVAPVAAAVVWIAGAMGWLGMPLGVATSTFCAIALGVGVDHAIHYREAWRRARDGGDPDPALAAVRAAGPAIVTDALAIALGFGLLALSRVPPNARLGALVAAALVTSAALTLAGLGAAPAALRGGGGRA